MMRAGTRNIFIFLLCLNEDLHVFLFCFVFLTFDPLNWGGGHLLKPGGRMHGYINPPFSNHSHPLTPFFRIALT